MPLDPIQSRRFAQRLIIGGVRAGLSGAAILRQLRGGGLKTADATFYKDYNRYKRTDPNLPRVNTAAYHTYLAQNFVMDIPARRGERNQYTFSYYGFNNDTGEVEKRFYSVSSNKPLIPDIAQAAVEAGVDFNAYNFTPTLSTVEFEGAYHFVSDESI